MLIYHLKSQNRIIHVPSNNPRALFLEIGETEISTAGFTKKGANHTFGLFSLICTDF